MPLTLVATEPGGGPDTLGLPLWLSYAPVWTSASSAPVLGNGTLQGRYAKVGALLVFGIDLVIGSTTTMGTGAWTFALPIGITARTLTGAKQLVTVLAIQAAAPTTFTGTGYVNSAGTTVALMQTTHSGTVSVGAAEPVAWAATDELHVSGLLEVA